MKNTLIIATAVAITLSHHTPVEAQNLLINGSFEQPPLSQPLGWPALPDGSTTILGWVSVDNVAAIGRADNIYVEAPYYGHPASDGNHFIYIDNNSYASASLNGIYQDFSTVSGRTYQVTFDAATEISYGSNGLLRVSAGDTVVNYTLPNANAFPLPPSPPYTFSGWSSYSFRFIATSSTTRLQFYDEGYQVGGEPTTGNASPLIDNVRVYATDHAIYTVIENQTVRGNGKITPIIRRGYVVFEADTHRGTEIVGFVLNNTKLFAVVPLQNYRVDRVSGPAGTTYTIMAKAESPGTQFAGTLLQAVYLRGLDSIVTLGLAGQRRLPKTLKGWARDITQNEQTGITAASELSGTYSLNIRASADSNATNETFEATVARLASKFLTRGYSQISLTPAQ